MGAGFQFPASCGGKEIIISCRSRVTPCLEPYERADFRINKAYVFDRWKLTLYGEVNNLLNRRNLRFDLFNGYDPRTGQAFLSFEKLVPILPSAGIALEF